MKTLRMLRRQPQIFVQVKRHHLRKIQPFYLMQPHQLLIHPQGSAARRQPQRRGRLAPHRARNNPRRLPAQSLHNLNSAVPACPRHLPQSPYSLASKNLTNAQRCPPQPFRVLSPSATQPHNTMSAGAIYTTLPAFPNRFGKILKIRPIWSRTAPSQFNLHSKSYIAVY